MSDTAAIEAARRVVAAVLFAPISLCLLPVAFAIDGTQGLRNVRDGYWRVIRGEKL